MGGTEDKQAEINLRKGGERIRAASCHRSQIADGVTRVATMAQVSLVIACAVSYLVTLTLAEVDVTGTLSCHQRTYQYQISKPFINDLGEVIPCSGLVSVRSCWGRCDSSEVADFRVPYKISQHNVCTYTSRTSRRVRLQDCHADHPDPYAEVFDASDCQCRKCTTANTSCEHITG
nr:glycoprotein beta [Urechis unicinctus]